MAVPCFLLISGIFFFRKYDFLDEDAQVGYLKNYLNRLGMLYLSWQILYLPFVVKILINYMRTHSNTLMSWVNYVFRFFVPFGFTLSGKAIIGYNGWIQSWYLIALWIGLPILIYASKLINDKLMLAICLVIECFFIISSEFGFISHIGPVGIDSFPRAIVYLYFARKLVHYWDKFQKQTVLTLVKSTMFLLIVFIAEKVIVCKMGGNLSDESIMTIPISVAVTVLSFSINSIKFDTYRIRNFSTFLYTSHYAIHLIWRMIFKSRIMVNGYVELVGVTLISFLLFEFYLFLRERTDWPALRYLI